MKRREIKFVAGSLQLAPDRIEADAATARKGAPTRRKGRSPAGPKARVPPVGKRR